MDIIEADAFLFNKVPRNAFLPLPTPNSVVASPNHPCCRQRPLHFPQPRRKPPHPVSKVIQRMCGVMCTSVEHKEVWALWSTIAPKYFDHTPVVIQPGRLCERCYPVKVSIHVRMSGVTESDKYVVRGYAYSCIPIGLMISDLRSIQIYRSNQVDSSRMPCIAVSLGPLLSSSVNYSQLLEPCSRIAPGHGSNSS